MHLKNRLSDVEADCRDRLHVWLLRIVGALTAPTSMALTCRWRSRPQHHKRTTAPQTDQVHRRADLLDHLVGAYDEGRWNLNANRLGSFEVNDKLDLSGKFNGQIRDRTAFENLMHISCCAIKAVFKIDAIADEPPGFHEFAISKNGGQPFGLCGSDNIRAIKEQEI